MNYFKFNKISKMVYLIAFMTFFVRACHFMSLPFLAIYLTRENLYTSNEIGIILGISGLVLSLTGLFNGAYLDRHSYKFTLISAFLLSGICYFCFAATIGVFWGLFIINAMLGWFRSLLEISLTTIMVKNSTPENLSSAFTTRMIGANLGVAIGPLIGALMSLHNSLVMFYIAGAVHCILGLGLLFYKEQAKTAETQQVKTAVMDSFKEVFKDKQLINITFINLIIWTVYAQLDTTIPQYLAQTGNIAADLFSKMMIINALMCVFLQSIIMKWAESTSLKGGAICGGIMFVLAFVLIAVAPSAFTMIIFAIILTLAELTTLPINHLAVMRIAPEHLRGSYVGFVNLSLLGFSIGPILGGFGLNYFGGNYTFLINAALAILVVCLYLKSNFLSAPKNNQP